MQHNLARLELVLLAGFVGVALALGYWQFFRQDEALGAGGALPPMLSARAPNLIFGAGAVFLRKLKPETPCAAVVSGGNIDDVKWKRILEESSRSHSTNSL